MKKFISLIIVMVTAFSAVATVFAAGSNVTYKGQSDGFIFAEGSQYSPTDLFANFKDVMPGDSITQKITVRNDASKDVKVKIYIRSLGAHEDSAEFLSKLGLSVRKSDDNEMAYMFDSSAEKTAQLTDWVCLGTLYSGGEVNLDVNLHVPTALDNNYMNSTGYIDWEFKVEEFPVEADDPKPPQTGNNSIYFWGGIMTVSVSIIVILLFIRRKKQEEEELTTQV